MSITELPAGTNAVLADMLNSGHVTCADGSRLPLHSHVPLLECRILQEWVKVIQPRRLLEIGLAYAVSTLFVCDMLDWDQTIAYHVIDPYQARDWQSIGWLNLVRAGYAETVHLHTEKSSAVLPQFRAADLQFDFVLIDGSHKLQEVCSDVEHATHLLAPGGVIALDDIHLASVQTAVAHLLEEGFQQLPIPKVFDQSLPVRLRRMSNTYPSRVVAFHHPHSENILRSTADVQTKR